MTTHGHRSLRQLTGRAKSQYLRALADRIGATADVADGLDGQIAGITVRGWTAPAVVAPAGAYRRISEQSPAQAAPEPPIVAEPSPPVEPAENPALIRREGSEAASVTQASAAAPFNPYAFSAMALLLNEGRVALETRLAEAKTPEHVAQLAEAQSVRIAPEMLAARPIDMAKLRTAFIDAVQQRIAHRRAVSNA